jgi:hypothetical protein
MKSEDITTLIEAYAFHWIIVCYSTIPEHIDVFISSCHGFINLVAANIGLLHSHPFTNSNFHFLIPVKSANSWVLLGEPKQVTCREVWSLSTIKGRNSTYQIRDLLQSFHLELSKRPSVLFWPLNQHFGGGFEAPTAVQFRPSLFWVVSRRKLCGWLSSPRRILPGPLDPWRLDV